MGKGDGEREAVGAKFPKRDEKASLRQESESPTARAGESSRMRRPKVGPLCGRAGIVIEKESKTHPQGWSLRYPAGPFSVHGEMNQAARAYDASSNAQRFSCLGEWPMLPSLLWCYSQSCLQ